MCNNPQLHHFLLLFRLVHFPSFDINGRGALLPTGLCLIWLRVIIFHLDLVLPCSIVSSGSILRQLQVIIPLSRKTWTSFLLRELKNHYLVVLVLISVCLFFIRILVVSGPHFTFNSSVIISTSLLLRCLLSDMYISLFSMVIMLFPLIARVLIYVFLLLGIFISFYEDASFLFCLYP